MSEASISMHLNCTFVIIACTQGQHTSSFPRYNEMGMSVSYNSLCGSFALSLIEFNRPVSGDDMMGEPGGDTDVEATSLNVR